MPVAPRSSEIAPITRLLAEPATTPELRTELYYYLVENSHILIWAIDPQGLVTFVSNRAAEKMYGETSENLLGRDFTEFVVPEQQDKCRRVFNHILKGRSYSRYEMQHIGLYGDPIHLSVDFDVHRNDVGDVEAIVGTAIDITKLKLSESKLREQQNFFRQVIDINPSFIFAKNRDGRFTLVNRAVANAYGTTVEDLIGKTDADFSASEKEVEHFREDDLEVMDKLQEKFIPEEKITDANGNLHWLQTVKRPIIGKDGIANQVLGVATDITERKKAENERRKLETQLRHAQKLESLGILAGGIAHDFNNLLMGILGNASLALLDMEDSPGAVGYVEKIRCASERAADLTNQLLAYSGRGAFSVEPASISKVVLEMGKLLSAAISKNAYINYDCQEELPLIEVDKAQLQQVVMNLITNASDAVEATGGTINIQTGVIDINETEAVTDYYGKVVSPGSYVYLEVVDNGSGIREEDKAKVFDPFFSTKFVGRGLGLAAVIGIIRGHSGAIQMFDTPGGGTTFKVLFPKLSDATTLNKEVVDSDQQLSRNYDGTILVIDDESDVRDVVTSMLEYHGYQVLVAGDGVTGITLFKKYSRTISLVLLDMTMPRLSGEEVFEQLREISPDIRILFSSGYSANEQEHTINKAENVSFIQKPYQTGALIKAIEGLV